MGVNRVAVAVLASALVVAGCNSQNGNPAAPPGTGGTGVSGPGGKPGSGGATATAASSGGASGSGGVNASGGATATRGTTSSGGTPSSGGTNGTGGVAATGGSRAAGGATTTVATGGSLSTGGSRATGGTTSTGGTNSTGGTTLTGGTSATGGIHATGGATGTGGTTKTCPTTAASLRAAAECTDRLVGVALSTQHLSESAYSTAAKEFNYVTAENEMKWDQIEPNRNQFTWSAADQIVNFATSNAMKVKGHTLVWYNQLPAWVSNLRSAAEVRSAMVAHIRAVMQHYKGKVAVWDVVNEAVSIEGTSYRDCPFYKYLGETYIDEAFAAAREADPTAKLYYNDYDNEGLNAKSDFVYDLLKGLKSRGVPIDGVGIQMHYGTPNDTFTTDELEANLRRLVDLGLEVVYSEMDVHMCSGITAAQQAALYHDLVAACVGEPQCRAVTFWGINDKYSWLNDYSPLGCSGTQKPAGNLWDDNFKRKATHTAVLNAFLGL